MDIVTILNHRLPSESIKKDYFRIGQEVDFRGNKSLYVNILAHRVPIY